MGHDLRFLSVNLSAKGLIQTGYCVEGVLHSVRAVSYDGTVISILKLTDLAGFCLGVGLEPADVEEASIKTVFHMDTIFLSHDTVEEAGDGREEDVKEHWSHSQDTALLHPNVYLEKL